MASRVAGTAVVECVEASRENIQEDGDSIERSRVADGDAAPGPVSGVEQSGERKGGSASHCEFLSTLISRTLSVGSKEIGPGRT